MVYGSRRELGASSPTSPRDFSKRDFLPIFCVIIVLPGFFFLHFVAQKQKAHQELARRSREMLEHFLGRLDLNDEEDGSFLAACAVSQPSRL
jgi:hypothetical protein